MAIGGLVSLALGVAASISVVADYLYGDVVRIPVTVAVLLGLGLLWFVVPSVGGRDGARGGRSRR